MTIKLKIVTRNQKRYQLYARLTSILKCKQIILTMEALYSAKRNSKKRKELIILCKV